LLPKKGWVLIRVLDREQTTAGGIVLPRAEQNKPMWEGIVLATWAPWTEEKIIRDADGKTHVRVIQHTSELERGDHVLIDHWAGVPVEGDSKIDTKFRLVKEADDPNLGGVKAIVEYAEKSTRPHEIITELLSQVDLDVNSAEFESLCRLAASKIEDRFILVDRDRQSVTMSGR
jgi:co-chaperonin GroES (HSP10)